MMTALSPLIQLDSKRLFTRSLLIGSLAATGLLLGWVPSFRPSEGLSASRLVLDNAAYAQAAVSESEIQSYARSVLEIEPIRQAAYDSIKRQSGAEVPPILCHRPSSLNNLDPSIRPIAIDYCNQAIAIVERNNLSITRFNEITVAHQSDSGLADRIQQAIAAIQGQ
ncbi:MAG TPA: DUF4168 domain-containing protein [Coleofasciculaceae cyanobacterium]